jgi:nucleoside-diphosphate-sugar epimerase
MQSRGLPTPQDLTPIAGAYRGKRVVVSGASGYLAAAVLARLHDAAASVVRISRASLAAWTGKAGCVDLIGDPRDAVLWREAVSGADAVFHLAAQTSVYTAAQDPDADFAANVEPMRRLLEACRPLERRPFVVFAGSVTQCGLPARVPVDESFPDEPVTMYDLHKLLAENALEGYCRQGLARGATLRLPNIYGPGPKSGSADRGVLNAMVLRALRGEPLTIYGAGDALRDYLYIDDAAEAFLAAGTGRSGVDGRHFVLGSGRGTTLAEAFRLVAERVAAKTGRRVDVSSVPEPAGMSAIEKRRFVADFSAFAGVAGWAPRVALAEGLDRLVDYARGAAMGAQG